MKNYNLLNYFSQQVNLYLDNRLTEESRQNLMEAIDKDDTCNQVFQKEKQFRDLIKSKTTRKSASIELINSIKKNLD